LHDQKEAVVEEKGFLEKSGRFPDREKTHETK
jgi:hypothetical protein